jgi:hypothetical protein
MIATLICGGVITLGGVAFVIMMVFAMIRHS